VTNLLQEIHLHSTHKITTNSHFISTEDIHISHTHTLLENLRIWKLDQLTTIIIIIIIIFFLFVEKSFCWLLFH